ncbi:hypothetical protein SUDANB1_06217 [Streptomyces sp. enrichment culture]
MRNLGPSGGRGTRAAGNSPRTRTTALIRPAATRPAGYWPAD